MDLPLWLYALAGATIAGIISSAINGGVTYLLYNGKEAETAMFAWPSTVAGDIVVTSMLGTVITWTIATQLTLGDCDRSEPFKLTKRIPASRLPSCFSQVAVYARRRIGDKESGSILCNLVTVALVGAAFGVVFTVTFGVAFMLVGLFALQDTWTLESLLIFKCILGFINGAKVQGTAVILASTLSEDSQELVAPTL